MNARYDFYAITVSLELDFAFTGGLSFVIASVDFYHRPTFRRTLYRSSPIDSDVSGTRQLLTYQIVFDLDAHRLSTKTQRRGWCTKR